MLLSLMFVYDCRYWYYNYTYPSLIDILAIIIVVLLTFIVFAIDVEVVISFPLL